MPDVVILGYSQTDLLACLLAEPGEKEGTKMAAVAVRDLVWAGREIQWELKGDAVTWPGGECRYAAKLDTTPKGKKEARALFRQDPIAYPANGTKDVFGLGRMRRLEDGTVVGEKQFVLNALDEAHLLDRLSSELWTWHASVHGEGPGSENGRALHRQRQAAAQSEKTLTKKLATPRDRTSRRRF